MSLTDVNRRVLEVIREAITPESFLLACIECPEAAIGICDAIRISGDMHNLWSNAEFSALNTAWRWWMHGKLFWNDPDMIPVRGPRRPTCGAAPHRVMQPYRYMKGDSGGLFNRKEAEHWMAFCLLSGGLFSLCDNMRDLNAAGRRIVATAMDNLSQVAAKPIDFYENGLPELYLQQDAPFTRIGVFNWSGSREDRSACTPTAFSTSLLERSSMRSGRGSAVAMARTVHGALPARSCLHFRFHSSAPDRDRRPVEQGTEGRRARHACVGWRPGFLPAGSAWAEQWQTPCSRRASGIEPRHGVTWQPWPSVAEEVTVAASLSVQAEHEIVIGLGSRGYNSIMVAGRPVIIYVEDNSGDALLLREALLERQYDAELLIVERGDKALHYFEIKAAVRDLPPPHCIQSWMPTCRSSLALELIKFIRTQDTFLIALRSTYSPPKPDYARKVKA